MPDHCPVFCVRVELRARSTLLLVLMHEAFCSPHAETIVVELLLCKPLTLGFSPKIFVGHSCGLKCRIRHSEEPVALSASRFHQLAACYTQLLNFTLNYSIGLRYPGR